jgi:hypothetical protein
MDEELEVSVEQLLSELSRKGVPLPFEIGAFIALEACEQIVRSPMRVRTSDIWMGEIGEIMVQSETPASEEEAARALLVLVGELLVKSAPGVPPMLLELVERGPSSGQWTLPGLRDDLEACLLPLNRGATRRVLARLLREARRAGERASLRPSGAPDAASLDAELDSLLGIAPGELPPPKPIPAKPAPAPAEAPMARAEPAAAAPAAVAPSVPALPAIPSLRAQPEPAIRSPIQPPSAARIDELEEEDAAKDEAPTAPVKPPAREPEPRGPRLRTEDLLVEEEPRPSSGGAVIGGIFVFAAVVLGVAYLTLGQMGARKLLGLSPTDQAPAPSAPPSAAARPVSGELRVTSTPSRAQVLLFVGTGPALATDLSIGVAQEFVAIADGHLPTRAVVPADAQWEPAQPGAQARYELAMQTGKTTSEPGEPELGATLLTQNVGQPSGSLGTVRVITTPPGAKVYQLIGFTPDARVSGLKLDRAYELLVSAPGYVPEHRRLEVADFKGQGSERVAALEVVLTKRKR